MEAGGDGDAGHVVFDGIDGQEDGAGTVELELGLDDEVGELSGVAVDGAVLFGLKFGAFEAAIDNDPLSFDRLPFTA